ncbi:bZIP transcription factor 27 isoform X1 [Arabidopsis lyrata subsp. lyrata]|uniref:bZIP transcription factor 27 isoform X1 n=1 Tax=Arabidopsis lyrata subsp. lyrata TaxID=81972 RepID=UPI000A29CE8B|nr:bZIP transcription factor 27 isoform X1 [Arabidopsis lyrata subsp. lyrata]XP_020889545.1 bZIP transcription factor 27 isoform X1 [Arabidopsis lyrata subsp. lyrata]|eukprot:XP_020889544.1 bZIP transcription factor 27 isoform X1 [Arabidopsis lyrata subsp. lyrata]
MLFCSVLQCCHQQSIIRSTTIVPSSSSSSTSSSLGHNNSQVTMEEVWKEINNGSLHYHRQLNIGHEPMLKNQNPNNSTFQDFLNMPLNQQPPSTSSIVTALYGSLPLPPPATVLSLNSGVGFEFLDTTETLAASNPHSFEESARVGCLGKKRSQDPDESRGDRRYKRMIKNRESAARSRARKQECVSLYSSNFQFL